jgi:hypothetical protein
MAARLGTAASPRRRSVVLDALGAVLFSMAIGAGLPAGCAHAVYGDPKAPVAGHALGTTIHTANAEELRFVALQLLTDRYAAQQGITVSAEETQAYVRAVRQAMSEELTRAQARRDELAARLASGTLSAVERERLTKELELAQGAVEMLADAASPASADAADAQARMEIAASFVRQWKINASLWRRYGGRIGYQQGGPEPLDAYRAFLEEAQARGDFRITDPALEAAFWRYYTDDTRHSFYPRGSPEEARAFETPPWAEASAR